jgi:hypothetical protein
VVGIFSTPLAQAMGVTGEIVKGAGFLTLNANRKLRGVPQLQQINSLFKYKLPINIFNIWVANTYRVVINFSYIVNQLDLLGVACFLLFVTSFSVKII